MGQLLDGRGVPGWHENGGEVDFSDSFINKVDDSSRIMLDTSSNQIYYTKFKIIFLEETL